MSKKCTIEIIDQVACKIHGLDPPMMRVLKQKLGYFQQWARHIPTFKSGYWDGMEFLIDGGGKTYTNMLEDILPSLIDHGWEISLDDKRPNLTFDFPIVTADIFSDKNWPAKHKFEHQPIVLHEDQVNAINLYLNNLCCTAVLPTSFGKTLVTAAMSFLCEPYGNTIVIVPNKGLVVQTEEDYNNLGLDVGVYFGDRKELGHKHTICTWQVLSVLTRKSKKHNPEDAKKLAAILNNITAVIIDECHGGKAKELRKLLTQYLNDVPIRWGLTGTLPEDEYDLAVIKSTLGPNVGEITPKELQDKGILSKCNIEVLQLQDKYEFTDYQQEMKFLVEDPERLEWLSNFIIKTRLSGNTLLLVNRIATGKMLAETIPDSVFINGTMKVTDRKEHYDDVHDSKDKVIIATFGVAAVGINVPRIFNLVLFEPGKSFVRVIQSIGRGLRVAKDKDHVQIYDIASSCKYSKRHLAARKKMYKKKEYPFKITKITKENK